jgi:RNA polymerase sigma factor (sigma-70 family)
MDSTPLSLLKQLRGPARPEAWARLVHLYAPLIDRWAVRLGVQDADRADLVQEVLLALFRALPGFSYERGRSFRAWLHTIAVNKWRDFRRKRVPGQFADGDGFDAAGGEPQAEFAEAEYRSFVAGRALRLIQAEFQPATWRAFWGTVVEDRPADEVARQLGLTPNAVYLARGRVLRRLRIALEGLLE